MATPDSSTDPLNPMGAGQLPAHSELLLEALPSGVLVLAADGAVTYLNAAAVALWGVPATAVVGQLPAQVQPAVLPLALVQALDQPQANPVECWLPYTGQWISLRTAPAPEGQRWVFWENVTARQQAEQTLPPPQRELLQRTIDSSLDLVQVFEAVRDEQGQVVDFRWVLNNAAAEQVYGDVIGQQLCQLNPGVIEEGIFDTFKQVLETGVPDQSERHYVHEQFDGWFYQSTVKLGDGVTTTTHDITQRKRIEQELRESKILLQDIIDAPHIGIAVYRAVRNEAGAIVDFVHDYINRASVAMLGEDFTGRLFTDHGENARVQLLQFIDVLQTGRGNSYTREADFRGRQVWFAITNTPLDSERLVHTWEDVTERQQTQQQILQLKDELTQQAIHNYHALLEATTQGFCRLQLLFDETGQYAVDFRYLELNPAFVVHSGLPADAQGKTVSELVPNLEPHWLEVYGRVALTGQAEHLEYHVDQLGRWYDAHAFRLGPPEARQVGVLFSDITARKRREANLAFLASLMSDFAPLSTVAEVMELAGRRLTDYLQLSHCFFVAVDPEAGECTVLHHSRPAGLPALTGTYPLNDFHTPAENQLLAAGQSMFVRDVDDGQRTAAQAAAYRALDIRALVNTPHVAEGRWVFDLGVGRPQPGAWAPDEIELLQDVAGRVWLRLERAKAEEALRLHQQRTLIQKEAFQAAINGDPLPTSLNILLQLVKEQLGPEVRTAFYLAYPDGASLHAIDGAGDMPDTYTAALDGFPTGETSFCSGYAIAVGRPAHTPDVQAAAAWQPYRDLAAAHQFRACNSYPILTREGKAVGSVALYFPAVHQATAQEAAVAEAVAQAAGIILSRHAQTEARSRAEEALRASEEKYRTLFDTMAEGLAICRVERDDAGQVVDLRYQELNQALEALTGLNREAMLGKPLSAVLPPADLARWLPRYAAVSANSEPASFEEYTVLLDRWFAVSVYPRPGDELVVFYRDITERKQRELQQAFLLRFSDELRAEPNQDAVAHRALQMLIEQLGLDRSYLTTYYLDENRADLDYQLGNDTVPPLPDCFVLSDYPEALALTFTDTVVIEDDWERQGLLEAERRNSKQLGMRAMVAATLRKEQKPLWSLVAISSRPRRWTPGEIALVEAVAERTWAAIERAKAEAALRRADERYRSMTDNAPVLIWETDESGGTFANRHYTDFFGASFEEILQMGWTKFLHPEDAEAYIAAYQQAFERRAPYSYECRFRRADGEYRWLLNTGHPLGENRMVGFSADITDRKRAEEALRASEEKYRTLFDSIDEAFCLIEIVRDDAGVGVDYRLLEANSVFEQQTGVANARGKLASEYVPGEEAFWLEQFDQVARTGETARLEHYHQITQHWYTAFVARISGPGSNRVAIVFNDITERKRREQEQAFLLQLSDALRPLADSAAMERAAMRVLGETLRADRVFFATVNADGVSWSVREEYAVGLPASTGSYPLSEFQLKRLPQWQAGQMSSTADSEADPTFSAADRAAYAAFGLRAAIGVPLVKGGRFAALLCINQGTSRRWTEAELALTREAAERIWVALERARTEEDLRASEEQFRAVANLVPDLLWRSSPDSETIWYNQRWYDYTGQDPEDAAGYGWADAIHPDDRAESARRYRAAVASGQPLRQEHRIRSAAGEYRWFQVQARPIRNAAGEVTEWFGAATDIHARKLAELHLRREADAFRVKLHDALRSLVTQVDLQAAACQVLGEHLQAHYVYYAASSGQGLVLHPGYVAPTRLFVQRRAFEAFGGLLESIFHGADEVQVDDVRLAPQFSPAEREACQQAGAVALLGVVQRQEGQPTGIWLVCMAQPRLWDDEELQLLHEAADRVALVLERAHAQATMAADLRATQRLREVGTRLLREAAGQVLYDELLSAALALVQADAGMLQLFDQDQQQLRLLAALQLPPHLLASFRRIGPDSPTSCGQALARGERVFLDFDAPGQPDPDGMGKLHLEAGLRTAQSTPLVTRAGRCLGMLTTYWRQPHRPSERRLNFLDLLARQAADLLEQRLIEATLRRSEEQFRTVANLVPDLLWRSDAQGQTDWHNQRWLDYTGQTPEQAASRKWNNAVHPLDWPQALALLETAQQQSEPADVEYRLRNLHGQYRWFRVQVLPVVGATGEVEHWYGAATDIHQHKLALEAATASNAWLEQAVAARTRELQESKDLQEAVFHTVRHAITVFQSVRDEERRIVDFRFLLSNGVAERHLGRSIQGQTLRAITPEYFDEDNFRRMVEVTESGRPADAVLYFAYGEHPVYLHTQYNKFRDGVVLVHENVTERRLNELALQRHRELLQSVLDTTLLSMSVLEAVRDEAGTIQDFRIQLVNQELARETGRDDLVGKLYAQEYPGIVPSGLFELLVRAVETGEPQGVEYFYPYEDFYKWFSCQFVKLGDGVVATNLDITARKQAEDERFKNLQLLQQAESLVGLGSWEYDLRTEQFTWSAGMYHLFGIPQGQPVRLGVIFNFVTEESRPQAEYIKRCISTGACDIRETVQLRVNDQVRTVRIRAVVLRDEHAQPLKVLGMNLDISELKRLEADNLHLRLTQQRALFEAVQEAQEAERRRIAEGLHNGVGQTLYATKLQFDQARAAMPDQGWQRANTLLADAIRQTRAISHELVPMVLNEFGLAPALTDICRTLSASHLRFNCDIDLAELTQPLPASLELAVYRMAQELVQNIVKHAQATEATLALEAVPGFLLLRAEDNGVGFPAEVAERPGLGLRSIRDRVALLGGTVDMGSAPSVGTFVRLRLPLPSA